MLEAPDTAKAENTQVVFGRHCAPWTDEERDRLRPIVRERIDSKTLADQFPGRTLKAIMKQVARIRLEEGVQRYTTPGGRQEPALIMLDPDEAGYENGEHTAWRKRCRLSKIAFLKALARAGMHA